MKWLMVLLSVYSCKNMKVTKNPFKERRRKSERRVNCIPIDGLYFADKQNLSMNVRTDSTPMGTE